MAGYSTAPLGHIRYQVGLSISSIRDNIEQQDTAGVINHLRFLIAIAAPKLDEVDRRKLLIPRLPPDREDRDGSAEARVFEECMTTLEALLCALSQAGLYAWIDPPAGDASGLALNGDEASA